ncbi:MAG: hypothetical protein U1A73_11005 [Pseudomonas sp.]|nr:hypothetical protein [Pseudomonas sp.]
MADETEEPFSLEQLYGAIERHVQAHQPGAQTVAAWPAIEDCIRLPAVVIEMAEMEPGQDPGTGEAGLACRFEARVITDPIQEDHHQQAGYTVWVVEWTQQIYLGEAQWPWPDQPPGTLVLDLGDGELRPEEVP